MAERGSDKHAPRLDEEIGHEVEGMVRAGRSTHAEEWADPEPSGEGEPDVDRAPDETLTGGVPAGMTPRDVAERSELARHLEPHIFPADREELWNRAREQHVPDAVLGLLERLPADRRFENVQDVWTALGGGHEERRA